MMLILKGLAKMDGQGDLYDYSFDDVCKNTMIMMIMMNTTRGLGRMASMYRLASMITVFMMTVTIMMMKMMMMMMITTSHLAMSLQSSSMAGLCSITPFIFSISNATSINSKIISITIINTPLNHFLINYLHAVHIEHDLAQCPEQNVLNQD